MIKKQETRQYHYFDANNNPKVINVRYNLWFKNGELIDVRNTLTEIGFSVEKSSECWEYFSNKYN